MSRAQTAAVLVTAILSALDGYDVLSVTFAAPGIAADWGIGRGALGVALSAGLVGMALGSLLLAPLGDVVGRRRLVIVNLCLMSVGMFMTALADTIFELSAWRVVTGIGIGSMVPIITPLAAEFANARRRRVSLAIMSIGYPIGGTVGGLVAAVLLQRFDWPAVFLFGAAASALMLPAVLIWLPEPLAFLLERRDGGTLARVNRYLDRCGATAIDILPPERDATQGSALRAIFAPGRRGPTLVMTAINLLYIVTVYFMLSWMPQLVADTGLSAATATAVATLSSLAGVIASVTFGVLGAKLRLGLLMGAPMLGLACATAAFGFLPGDLILLAIMAAIVGALLYSGILALYASIVETFDPGMRATGVGFVMGVGRAGGAIAPALAGGLFALGATPGTVTSLLALGAGIAGVLALVATDHLRPQRAG